LEPIDIPEIQTKIPPSAPNPPAPPSPADAGFGGQARPTPPKQEPDPRIQGNIVDLKRDVKDV
jgi:hypothetical protein